MPKIKENILNNKSHLIIFIILIGTSLRIAISLYGYNVDMEYWRLYADVKKFNGPIYETGMNYAPTWSYILHFLDQIPFFLENEIQSLRFKVMLLLTLGDLAIFFIVLKIHSLKISSLFFLNPISIFITGYHSQFDNLAILVGLVSILLFEKYKKKLGFIFFSILMGISLTIKHTLIVFPIWIAIKEKKFLKKIIIVAVPLFIFFMSFILFDNSYNIIFDYILGYVGSNENAAFWKLFTPLHLGTYIGYKNLFFISLVLLGLFLDKENKIKTFYLYLISVVLLSNHLANQYLAIPVLAIAYFWNRFYLLYTISCCLFFLVDFVALDLVFFQDLIGWTRNSTRIGYKIIILFLALGFLETIISKEKLNYYIKIIFYTFLKKIKKQLKIK